MGMNIVLGASGQVGGAIIDHLVRAHAPVTGIVRSAEKAEEVRKKTAGAEIADTFDLPALKAALRDGETVFLLTPETGKSDDVIGDTITILANYREAIAGSAIQKIVGLSSIGAQHGAGTGNLVMSFLLEHAFQGLEAQQIFVRPAYYFSNWLPFLPVATEQGILPTFYPIDQKFTMIAPTDVAEFVAGVMTKTVAGSPIYEIEGPEWYSSRDVAETLSGVLGRAVEARQTPRDDWGAQLKKIGYTDDAVKNFVEMTDAVIRGDTGPERNGTVSVKTRTTLKEYFTAHATP